MAGSIKPSFLMARAFNVALASSRTMLSSAWGKNPSTASTAPSGFCFASSRRAAQLISAELLSMTLRQRLASAATSTESGSFTAKSQLRNSRWTDCDQFHASAIVFVDVLIS